MGNTDPSREHPIRGSIQPKRDYLCSLTTTKGIITSARLTGHYIKVQSSTLTRSQAKKSSARLLLRKTELGKRILGSNRLHFHGNIANKSRCFDTRVAPASRVNSGRFSLTSKPNVALRLRRILWDSPADASSYV